MNGIQYRTLLELRYVVGYTNNSEGKYSKATYTGLSCAVNKIHKYEGAHVWRLYVRDKQLNETLPHTEHIL
jgi:hypothetical protein